MPTNGYVSTSTLKSYLAISDAVDDSELDQAIDGASRLIDGICRRRFYQDSTTSTRVYEPFNCRRVYTDDISTDTDLVVKTDTSDDGTYDTTIASTNYVLEPHNGVVEGLEGWPYTKIELVESDTFPTAGRRPRVQVQARWGWAATPEPVQQACLIVATELFKRKDAPFGVAGLSDFGVLRIRDDPRVMSLLRPYVRGSGVAVA